MTELHEKYAPMLTFHKSEKFYPMRVDDMLSYCSLYSKGSKLPLVQKGRVTPELLVKSDLNRNEVFLRSVDDGPLYGQDVIRHWSEGALEMIYRWSSNSAANLADNLARKAYTWLNKSNRKGAELFWWNSMLKSLLEDNMESVKSGELPRLLLAHQSLQSAKANYDKADPGPAYYYREVEDSGYLCLQYWFFYSFNDWGSGFKGMNDHEGDWEGMMLFFKLKGGRPQEPPVYVTYADHESRQTKPWDDSDVTIFGNHAVGYVAAGSHATYPQREEHALMALYGLVDYATGDGDTINHKEWAHRINLEDVSWLGDYAGSWGTRFWLKTDDILDVLRKTWSASVTASLAKMAAPDEIELPGVSAPHGPMGPHRPQFANPVAWAGVPPA